MKDFFKFMFSSLIGTLLALIALFFILIIVGIAMVPKDEVVTVKENSILNISLSAPISDRAPSNPFEDFNFQSFEPTNKLGLHDILTSIERAKTDDNIKGIYLSMSDVQGGMATLEEIRDALVDFKSSGKFILSYADFYSQKAYYLATTADQLYLNPQGLVDYRGLCAEMMFFKGAMDKFGIQPQIIRGSGNKFKSAVEPFMYDKMSDANREQTLTYLNSLWNHMLTGISESRNISVAQLNLLADQMTIDNAQAAVENKMIDGTKYKDEILAELRSLTDREASDKLDFIKLNKYIKSVAPALEIGKSKSDKIAIIYATGEIQMGAGSESVIGSENISKAVRQARIDTTVKAIVLRVNSPGGSALASDIILREMTLAKAEKPIIVSMGDVAASGGYYVACLADTIVASENTITGSIGVFGLMFNIENFLSEYPGISIDRVMTNDHADLGSMTRNLTEMEKAVVQKSVDDIYYTFKSYVAEGRGMTIEEVDAIGQGRVWSGENAKEIGLVDVFGGMNTAIAIAAEKANLENYELVDYPTQKDPMEMILENFSMNVETYFAKRKLGEQYKYYEILEKQLNRQGIMARMPFDPVIQ